MAEGIFTGLIFAVAFSFMQRFFPVLYRPGTFPVVGLVMAIVFLLLYGWGLAVAFYAAQWLAYRISARFIKPWVPWGPNENDDAPNR
jgi:hypothetical protein